MWSCRFITCFVTVFAIVIAITKDLPDVEGDRRYNIKTLATTLGVRNIAFLGEQPPLASQPHLARTCCNVPQSRLPPAGSGLLCLNYLGAVVLALRLPNAFRVPLMIGAHCLLAVGTIWQTLQLQSKKYSASAIQAYYRFIWNLLYTEYVLLPFL